MEKAEPRRKSLGVQSSPQSLRGIASIVEPIGTEVMVKLELEITVHCYICCLLEMAPSLAIGAEAMVAICGRTASRLVCLCSSEALSLLIEKEIHDLFDHVVIYMFVPLVIRTPNFLHPDISSLYTSTSIIVLNPYTPKPSPQDHPC
jgi:hypothetical protein